MKRKLQALAASMLLGTATFATAVPVNIGGLTLSSGTIFEVASVYENVITGPGQTLAGVGEISQINGVAVSSLCAGCELTYQFGGYTVTALSPNQIAFSGGYVNFYLGSGADNDFNPFASTGSADDIAAASNGTLFLTLAGHAIDGAGNTFYGGGVNIGTPDAFGFGVGFMDVDATGLLNGNTAGAGALANANFNTNSILSAFGGNADLQLGSSFSSLLLPHAGECPGGPMCIAGSVDARGLVVAIPEPQTYALMLAGLGVVGFLARRRRQS
jgi:hypothetical protein